MGHDTGTGGGRLRICAESAGAEDSAERQPRLLVGFEKKMDDFFTAHGFNTLHILHNNHYAFGQYGICGTRGWVSMQEKLPMPKFWQEKCSGFRFPFSRLWTQDWNPLCSCTIRRSTERR